MPTFFYPYITITCIQTIKVHPANIQPPIQPYVKLHNISKLISTTQWPIQSTNRHNIQFQMLQCNTIDQRSAILLFVLHCNGNIQKRIVTIQVHSQTNKYYKCTYPVCGTTVVLIILNYFFQMMICLWPIIANLFPNPQLIVPDT